MVATIEGVGLVKVRIAEYADGAIADLYQNSVRELLYYFLNNGTYSGTPIFNTDANQEFDALIGNARFLRSLAVNGFEANGYTQRLTAGMAASINMIFKTLKAAGIDLDENVTDPKIKGALFLSWQTLSDFNVIDILNAAYAARSPLPTTGVDSLNGTTFDIPITRTLQSMVELEYVKQGNELIFNKLGGLQSALTITKGVLSNLATLQNGINQISIAPPPPFSVPQGHTTVAAFVTAYKQAASAYFKQQSPTATMSGEIGKQVIATRERLVEQLLAMEATQSSNNRNVPNSLAYNIYRVLSDLNVFLKPMNEVVFNHPAKLVRETLPLNDYINTPGHAQTFANVLNSWVLDKQNVAPSSPDFINAGAIQDRLTQAIRAGESLNDTQKENVRQYMFIFEEFYKSASAILTKLNQIIEKIAQNMAR
jgi:hypothetical protein